MHVIFKLCMNFNMLQIFLTWHFGKKPEHLEEIWNAGYAKAGTNTNVAVNILFCIQMVLDSFNHVLIMPSKTLNTPQWSGLI